MKTTGLYFTGAEKAEVVRLLAAQHYIGPQCAEAAHIFAWRTPGGLFGDYGQEIVAAALFAPPASHMWGPRAVELVRLVRAPEGVPPLSGFLAECVRWLRRTGRWDVVVAYADPAAGHHGGVYQAANFWYLGRSAEGVVWTNGRRRLSRRAYEQPQCRQRGVPGWEKRKTAAKHLYVYPLRGAVRRELAARVQRYPKPGLEVGA